MLKHDTHPKYDATQNQRLYAIDHLRILAFGLLMLYHLGMVYVGDWAFHIKSDNTYTWLQYPMLWSNPWRMRLIFLISGIALGLMLKHNSAGQIIKRRLLVLGLPFVAGVFIWVAPQVFIELKTQGLIDDGFLKFLGAYWHPFLELPAGYARFSALTWTWNHLWFLPYVITYSVLGAIAFKTLQASSTAATCLRAKLNPSAHNTIKKYPKSPHTRRVISRLASRPYLAVLLLAAFLIMGDRFSRWLYSDYPPTYAYWHDMLNHARFGLAFAVGVALSRWPWLLKSLGQYWRSITLSACLCFALFMCGIFMDGGFMDESFMDESFMDEIFMCDGLDCKLFAYPLQAAIYGTVTSANSALWQLAALALAIRFLNTKVHWVRPFKNRIFCFYVIHQTALIVGLYLSQTTPFSLTPHIFNRVLEPLTVSLFMLAVCEISYRCGLRWRLLGKTLGIR